MFEFKVNLDDDDYLQFNQYHLFNSPVGKKSLMSFRFGMPFVAFMVVLALWIVGSDLMLVLVEAVVMTIFSICWIVYSKKHILKSMKKSIKQMKKAGRLPYSNEAILKFNDESIHELTPDTENKTKYSLIEKIAVTEKAIYIYVSSAQAYMLPVSIFIDEKEKQKFLEFINLKAGIIEDTK